MKYRRLGNSGLKVSEIALGSWLTYGDAVDKQNAIDCVHKAYDLGVNFFDTANAYNRGSAEEVVGEAIKGFSFHRLRKEFLPVNISRVRRFLKTAGPRMIVQIYGLKVI
jgi:aryl-alcohol dehydrogenase-like predicted oxidoreductase